MQKRFDALLRVARNQAQMKVSPHLDHSISEVKVLVILAQDVVDFDAVVLLESGGETIPLQCAVNNLGEAYCSISSGASQLGAIGGPANV